jgi:hypothetical protein
MASAQDERILNFKSVIVVNPDASLTVTEDITVKATGQEIKRGIIRDFPTTYRDRLGNTVTVGFKVEEVWRDGRPEPYRIESASNGVKIRIGSKDVFLKAGVYTYTIRYRVDRELGFFKDFDELYWNVTGNGWTFAIDRAEAIIELPPQAKILSYAAYTGYQGDQGRDFTVKPGDHEIMFTTTRGLASREGLTVKVSWPKGVVYDAAKSQQEQRIADLRSGKIKIANIEDAKLAFNASDDDKYTYGLPIDGLKNIGQYYIWKGTLSWKSGKIYFCLDDLFGKTRCFGFTDVIERFNEMRENSIITVLGKLEGESEVTLTNKLYGFKETRRVPFLSKCYVF